MLARIGAEAKALVFMAFGVQGGRRFLRYVLTVELFAFTKTSSCHGYVTG